MRDNRRCALLYNPGDVFDYALRHIARLPQEFQKRVLAPVAIDDFRADSGCLEVVPGSHKLGPLGLGWEANTHRIEAEYQDVIRQEAVQVDLKAGDAVLFHGLLLHGSPGNHSPHARRSLTVCFYPGDLSIVSTRRDEGNTSGHRPQVRRVM